MIFDFLKWFLPPLRLEVGGGGGSDRSAARANAAAEAKRQQARELINNMFGYGGDATIRPAREQQYSAAGENAFNFNKLQLDEDRTDSLRKLKFGLARTGLFGGSADVDQNALVERKYNKGILDIGNRADRVRNEFRAADEGTRLDLLSRVDAGLDPSSAASAASNALDVNTRRAYDAARGEQLGDVFGGVGDIYDARQDAGYNQNRKRYADALGAWFKPTTFSGTVRP